MLRRFPAAALWPGPREQGTRSSRAPINREPLDPDRKANCRNGVTCSETRQQPVIAAARNKRVTGAFRVGQLENQPRVVVETAAEGGREPQPLDVDAARLEKARAAFKLVK